MVNNVASDARTSPLLEYGITKSVLQNLPNIQQLNKAATVCKSWNEAAKIIKRTRRQIYCTSNQVSLGDCACVDNLISVMKSQPLLCIALLTHEGIGEIPPPLPEFNLSEYSGTHKGRCTEYRLLCHLKERLPLDCVTIGGVASGVITSTLSLETNELEDGDGYGLIFMPKIPNISVKNFYLDKQKIKKVCRVSELLSYHYGTVENDLT